MGMSAFNIHVDQLVSIARRAAPDALELLARKFPENKEIFEAGATLGETEAIAASTAAALLGLDVYSAQADQVLNMIRKRLTALSYFELISKIVSATGGAVALGSILKGWIDPAIVASSLSLLGTLAGAAAGWIGGGLGGRPGTLVTDFDTLVGKLVSAQSVGRKIRILQHDEAQRADLVKYLTVAEGLAEDLNRFVLRYRAAD